jgi:hypothetical protein
MHLVHKIWPWPTHSVLLRVLVSGIRLENQLDGTWRTVLKRARFALVDGVPLRQAGYDFDNSPMSQQYKDGAKFGNCAETYPFVDLLVYVMFLLMRCPLLIGA